MHLKQVSPNPLGGIDRLYLLQIDSGSDAVQAPVSSVVGSELLGKCTGSGSLRIFHFNDLHNHLQELSGPMKGTHQFSQFVKRVRQERSSSAKPTLFLSIGDDHTGTMLDELMGWRSKDFILDASYRAYSEGGVDATVLGNHEFDRGSELLAMGIRQDANFPVLSANIHSSQHLIAGEDYSPAAIAVIGNLRIGLLGLTTHVETRVGQEGDLTLAVASPSKVVENILPALAPLVDVVLILSHCGFGDGVHKSGKSAALRDIGEADFSIAQTASKCTSKPVLILGAHTHTKLNENEFDEENLVHGIPVFQAECNGNYLGEIEMHIDPEYSKGYAITSSCLHSIKPFNKTIGPGHSEANKFEQPEDYDEGFEQQTIAPIVERVARALDTTIVTVKTDCFSFTNTVLSRYAGECALANLICDAICERLKQQGFAVDLALLNGATLQAGMERGSLTAGEWFNVMPYADEVFIVRVKGHELEQILHSNAKRLLRAEEYSSTDHTGFLARGFFHTSAKLRYIINSGASATAARAENILIDGNPHEELLDHEFNVIMSTYLALGGFGERWNGQPICGGVPGVLRGHDLRVLPSENTRLVFRDELSNYLRQQNEIDENMANCCDGRLKIQNLEKKVGNHE